MFSIIRCSKNELENNWLYKGCATMNISNFETHFDEIILERGFDYYHFDHVLSLGLSDNKWKAKVAGSEDYIVITTLSDNGDIIETRRFGSCMDLRRRRIRPRRRLWRV